MINNHLKDAVIDTTPNSQNIVSVVKDGLTRFKNAVALKSRYPRFHKLGLRAPPGFSLIELVITLTILTILTLGVLPLATTAIRRQREQTLRESLREIRSAIDEFHRDTVGMQCMGTSAGLSSAPGFSAAPDSRSQVIIADCTIFGVDNPDRYPPTLDVLVNGVAVVPRIRLITSNGPSGPNATDITSLATKQKVYLRRMPIDPFTGKPDWVFRSSYDPVDAASWGGENVFDIHSAAKDTALNHEKYSDW